MKLSTAILLSGVSASPQFPEPLQHGENSFDFTETQVEIDGGWDFAKRCGQAATAGTYNTNTGNKDQRKDPNCPNVLLINTDDMAWGDLSVNNPSKLIPTPNLDKLISKGINFRDGHSCTARCAPARYCLMTGRYHFRRGDYHYKPMELEYGRKVLTHLFKRNNYHTMVVGKPQPVEAAISSNDMQSGNLKSGTDFYFIEGTSFWGYDRSFTSRSYCCLPGGGYFVNDQPREPFDRYAIFTDFRVEDEGSVQISADDERDFWLKPENYHLLDGYTVSGHPDADFRPTTYMAYWNAVKNGEQSGLNRRRRDVDGKLIRRATKHNKRRNAEHNIIGEVLEHRIRRGAKVPRQSYVRFQEKSTGRVILANHRLIEGADRSNYEFAVGGETFGTYEEAEAARLVAIDECKASGRGTACNDMVKSRPKKTQISFDSRYIMKTFHQTAIDYITEHVETNNPQKANGQERSDTENQPFFLYLSFRAPHRPYSHGWSYDESNPHEHMPYVSLGKPGEQIGLFDEYVGNVMKSLHDNDIADNTLVFFTSDNGPDQGAFNLFNKMGHMRMATMRGKKASVYEGGHRVPFLSWWPLGTHKALYGTNFDLPVGQVDFFATFADILNYPLPGPEHCKYAFDSSNAPEDEDATTLGRIAKRSDRTVSQYENAFSWTKRVLSFNVNPCEGRVGTKVRANKKCDWVTCDECLAFWDAQIGTEDYRTTEWMEIQKDVFCRGASAGVKCVDTSAGFTSAVQIISGKKVNYLKEVQKLGYDNVELYRTKEEKTGFLLGWTGCMAEDSHSFADAYKVKDENPPTQTDANGVQFKEFTTKLDKVPSKIYSGKLGDLSLRLGRYKLVRFNAPKDGRTGPTRQHLNTHTKHEGAAWLSADWGQRCSYDEDGNSLNPGCTVEPMCRNYTTFGGYSGNEDPNIRKTTCMRDHYYQLWDLEKNFGEKTFCSDTSSNPRLNANFELEAALGIERFDMGAEGAKAPEKPSDKYGFGLGIESTPVGEWTNDCCVLNHDEKPTADPSTVDMCSMKIIKKGPGHDGYDPVTGTYSNDDDRKEWSGGSCVPIMMLRKGDGSIESFEAWTKKHIAYTLHHKNTNYTKYGWTEETHFKGFENLSEDTWEFGYGCSGVALAKPHREDADHVNNALIWDEDLQDWRQTSMADKFCKRPTAPEEKQFNVGCKVPDHDGPLVEGWEANHQWKENAERAMPGVDDGEVSSDDFGIWTEFVNCMKGAMFLLEGTAYAPETRETINVLGKANYISKIFENERPMRPDGTYSPDDMSPLSGMKIGGSNMYQNRAANLWSAISTDDREFHGGGSRYNEKADGSDSLVGHCFDKLPASAKSSADPYDIKPTYDLEMDLIGYYEGNAGQDTRLEVKADGTLTDTYRKKAKYYRKNGGAYKRAFAPVY